MLAVHGLARQLAGRESGVEAEDDRPTRSIPSPVATRPVEAALERVRRAPSILAAIHLAPAVRQELIAARGGGPPRRLLAPLVEAIGDESDTVVATAAVHALGALSRDDAQEVLRALLDGSRGHFAAHAAWSLRGGTPAAGLIEPLAELVGRGGLPGMHAQQVLAEWAATAPGHRPAILASIRATMRDLGLESGRRYLTETIGLIPGLPATESLRHIARDEDEVEGIRSEAILALAERRDGSLPASLARAAAGSSPLATAIVRARRMQALARRGPWRPDRGAGLTVAQVHLAAVLDAEASRAGMGDAGGVATLLSRLGTELARQPRIARVVTIGRDGGRPGAIGPGAIDPADLPDLGVRHRFEGVPLMDGEGTTFSGPWPSLVAARRGIRAVFLAAGSPDAVHLRMADPGSLAAMGVARQLGIPTVFTLAPDPHALIAAAERTGGLDRRTFAGRDRREALWYRVSLVARLADGARELVVFPRSNLRRDLLELADVDLSSGPPRHTVVAEGADLRVTDAAAGTVRRRGTAAVLTDLRLAIARLPASRQARPIVVSIGRLHPVKGMVRLVQAFAADDALAARANLVIVGGDLRQPDAVEAAELARIHALFEDHPGLRERVVLLGHRPHAEAALVLAAASEGWGRGIAPGGAYACGSLKEEFGLAIVEALAAGLPVVAPRQGGPATYVEPGRTGVLVDTSDAVAIAAGIRGALDLASDPTTAARCRELVERRFTLDRMARTLSGVYRLAVGAGTLALPRSEDRAA